MLEARPHRLASEAPVGEYRVDTVALELRGAALSTCGEDEFIRLFREDVSAAAALARNLARDRPGWGPKKSHLTNRLSRIKRLLVSTNPISIHTRSALQLAAKAIEDDLESYLPNTKRGGNYDWLTRNFIDECFKLWCRHVQVELNKEAQVFNKFVTAAWRDVGFPTEWQDGRCLKEWLADRVRKHFHDGICNARREQQERIRAWNSPGKGGAYLPLVIRARVAGAPKSRVPGPPKMPL
jgi:hypothetical protein